MKKFLAFLLNLLRLFKEQETVSKEKSEKSKEDLKFWAIDKKDKTSLKNRLSKNFLAREFICGCDDCSYNTIDVALVKQLQLLREVYGGCIRVTSGYRCSKHHDEIYRKLQLKDPKIKKPQFSQHLAGRAADITCDDINRLRTIIINNGLFDGVGTYLTRNIIHVDTRGSKVQWSG